MSRVLQNKKLLVMAFAAVIALVLLLAPTKALAANATYKIIYSAGNVASFTEEAVAKYKALEGTNGIVNVEQTKAGNIRLDVEYGAAVPNAPTANDITYKDGKDGRYTLTDTWTPKYGDLVTENKTYVMDYQVITDGVAFKILYVDDQGYQLAPAVVSIGNIGETRTPAALTIDGYTCSNPSQSIALNIDAAKNVVTFSYTSNQAAPTIEGQPAQVAAPVAAGGAPAAGPAAAPAGPAVENVADEATPLASGTTQPAIETVEDEETPLASAQSTMLLPVVVIVLIAVVAAITFLAIRADRIRRREEGR